MKNICILGATGSIGTQSLEVIEENKGFRAFALSAHSNISLLETQIRKFRPAYACVQQEDKAKELKQKVADTETKILCGEEGLCEIAAHPEAETVITGIVGIAGLSPTIAAVEAKKRIGLANKETLVTAGELVMRRVNETGAEIIPVDSEHSAIFQSLAALENKKETKKELKRILLTASGGPFFGKTKEALKDIRAAQALRHPNWSMGAKITVDSASLMNKGLEVIEAKHLFDVSFDQIEVLVHRQSIVHSMVEFTDNAVIAQLGAPDMKLPIQYAITYPARYSMQDNALSLAGMNLTFDKPDTDTFRCLSLAIEAGKEGGTVPTVLNGANEAAVGLFLQDKIGFLQIADLVEGAIKAHKKKDNPTIADIWEADKEAREYVLEKRHTIS